MRIKVGDVVRLVSGGPLVTVERVEECPGSTLHRDAVPVSAVVEVQP
jgi:uncharacterized protein YodC (DUF2158 family)